MVAATLGRGHALFVGITMPAAAALGAMVLARRSPLVGSMPLVRAAAHTTNGFTSLDGVRFSQGQSHVKTYKVPDAKFFPHAFCDVCGSGLTNPSS